MTDLFNLLHSAVKFIGDCLIVLGLIQIGLTLKDGTAGGGGQLNGALTMLVAGGCIRECAQMVSLPDGA